MGCLCGWFLVGWYNIVLWRECYLIAGRCWISRCCSSFRIVVGISIARFGFVVSYGLDLLV